MRSSAPQVAFKVRGKWNPGELFREGFLEKAAVKLRLEGWIGYKKVKEQESL